jgi:hypothetical protein
MQVYRHGQINHFEKKRLHRDGLRYRVARRKALRDGFINKREHRKLVMMRKHHRHEFRRLAHNGRRVI